jgi:prepilin-type N-terminal cleavage/methylation domain-containing protein
VRSHRGFTLIELTAVLVILALLSSVVGLSLASLGRQTLLQDAVSAVGDLDRSMRNECMDYNRTGELRFDPDAGQIVLNIERDGEDVDVQAYQLPVGMQIMWVRLAGNEGVNHAGQSIAVPCDHQGQTPTYAYAMKSASSNDSVPVIKVVAGLSGQTQELTDESQVTDLFTELAGGNAG